MDEMRYRKPSVKTMLGITKLKKRVKKALGINTLLAPFRAVRNYQRRLLRRAGYYSPEMKLLRAAKRGQVPGPIGPLQLGTHQEQKQQSSVETALLAAALTRGEKEHHAQGHATHDQQDSGLAEAMLLATALKGQDQDDEQAEAHAQSTTRKPALTAAAKQAERHLSEKARSRVHQNRK